MSDYTKQIKDALDIIKYDSDIADTLSELRGKWDIPALRDPRLDSVAKQYITLPHTEGVDALGQELSSLGWLLYDLDGDDIYLFVLIPDSERDEFERYCRAKGQFCRLAAQRGRKVGQSARARRVPEPMPADEYNISERHGLCRWHISSFSGDWGAGVWRGNESKEWQGACVAELKYRPPRVMKLSRPYNFSNLTLSPDGELCAATASERPDGDMWVYVGNKPTNADMFSPLPRPDRKRDINGDNASGSTANGASNSNANGSTADGVSDNNSYSGDCPTTAWIGKRLFVGSRTNVAVVDFTSRPATYNNFIMPEGDRNYRFGADGLGRVYFSCGEYLPDSRNRILWRWENGKVERHHLDLAPFDDISNSIPLGAGQICMYHETSGNPIQKNLLLVDMDSGNCRIANLPRLGENARISRLCGDWVLLMSNGEDKQLDLAQIWNIRTNELLRVTQDMFGSERLEAISALADGSILIASLGDNGQILRYPTDFFDYLRRTHKPQKLESWRPYHEKYPDIPDRLPPKPPEYIFAVKKGCVNICGHDFTPPFTLDALTDALGPARLELYEDIVTSPAGTQKPVLKIFAVWDELGLRGSLAGDEQTVDTLTLFLSLSDKANTRKILPEREFSGSVLIGARDCRDNTLKWQELTPSLHRLESGGFRLYMLTDLNEASDTATGNADTVDADMTSPIRIELSWQPPKPKKTNKYRITKPDEPLLVFKNLNFKLAVVQHLMYDKGLLEPRFDAHEFAAEYTRRKIDIDSEGYEPIPEILRWFEKLPVPARLAEYVTELEMDGGDEIYTQICPFWDGEDNRFSVDSIAESELKQFPKLKRVTLMSSRPEWIIPLFERLNIEVTPL